MKGEEGENREEIEGFIEVGLGWPDKHGERRSRRGSPAGKFGREVGEGLTSRRRHRGSRLSMTERERGGGWRAGLLLGCCVLRARAG